MGLFRKQNKEVADGAAKPSLRERLEAKDREKKTAKEAKKTYKIDGIYYGSHPDIQSYKDLKLEFSINGVNALNKKKVVRTFGWNEVTGFDRQVEDKTQLQTTQRVTVTRMAAVGVFALAAPKSKTKGNVESKFYFVLQTTTGNIELEDTIGSGGAGGGAMGDLARSSAQFAIGRQEKIAGDIKRYVAEHATGKAQPAAQAGSVADEIERFAELKEKGVITPAEFEAKKKALLGL